jgi:hypothetical protein
MAKKKRAYAPNPTTHTSLSDRVELWSVADGQYCSENNPCPSCGGDEEDPLEHEENRQAATEEELQDGQSNKGPRHVSDSDSGKSGEEN